MLRLTDSSFGFEVQKKNQMTKKKTKVEKTKTIQLAYQKKMVRPEQGGDIEPFSIVFFFPAPNTLNTPFITKATKWNSEWA